ncbi:MAG TPA: FAD-dependent oxidoreductase [Gemmatimonadaceae bacterium]|nr:FAD-dependent oxidoreductase [Gemmatimonadaceae bacterium]
MSEILSSRAVTRRDALKWIAVAGAAQALGACTPAWRRANPSARRVLPPVRVSPDRVIRQVVGLRPFRRPGFLVRADSLTDKLLIHNYGHGGGGVSLSWGTADMAVELALSSSQRQAAVVGCGAVGLATARLLQDRGFGVTIYTRDLPPNTTSNIAGAQWSPVTVADADRVVPAFQEQFLRASRFAYRYFQNLVGGRYGITWRENYSLSSPSATALGAGSWEGPLLRDLLPRTVLAPDESPFPGFRASRFLTMHIEPSIYLPAVLQDFRIAGGRVVIREFADARAIVAVSEPVIVNCTGLAAGKLFDDPEVLPIKGQLTVLAPQPEVEYITIGPGDLYMMPRQDGIVLGGTHERGEWSLEPNPNESTRILRGHEELFAAMK